MHNVEVALAIVSLDLSGSHNHQYLMERLPVDDGEAWTLPRLKVSAGKTTFDAAAQLLESIVNLKAKRGLTGWVELRQHRLYENGSKITVPYSGMVPKDVTRFNGSGLAFKWLSVVELLKADQHKGIFGDDINIISETGRQP